MKQLPNLTSLRFFLALFVILYHLPQFCINRGFPAFNNSPIFFKGNEAVLAFFSLSGFLIIRNLILEKEKNGLVNLKKFYLRRILRIFPLYYLVLIIGFVFYHIIAPQFGYKTESDYNLLLGITLGVTFFANILFVFKPGGILEILWSIGIEEQFYLMIAPILKIIKMKGMLFFLIIFTFIYFLLFHFFDNTFYFLKKYSMYFYFFSFSGVIAFISLKYKFSFNFFYIKLFHVLIFCLIFFTDLIKNNCNYPVYQLICMIVFSNTIWILSLNPLKLLNNKVINYLGKISYGIYMFHTIIFQLVGYLFIKFNFSINLSEIQSIILFYTSVILITIIISHFSYNYYESYFIKLKKH